MINLKARVRIFPNGVHCLLIVQTCFIISVEGKHMVISSLASHFEGLWLMALLSVEKGEDAGRLRWLPALLGAGVGDVQLLSLRVTSPRLCWAFAVLHKWASAEGSICKSCGWLLSFNVSMAGNLIERGLLYSCKNQVCNEMLDATHYSSVPLLSLYFLTGLVLISRTFGI